MTIEQDILNYFHERHTQEVKHNGVKFTVYGVHNAATIARAIGAKTQSVSGCLYRMFQRKVLDMIPDIVLQPLRGGKMYMLHVDPQQTHESELE